MTLRGETISFEGADGARLSAYRVEPSGPRVGGLVLVQEIFGVTDHIRELCDGFAADGFETIAPALYDREEPGFEADYTPQDIARAREIAESHPIDLSVGDMTRIVERLAPLGPVFAVGYCYGGSMAWLGACRVPGLAAASGYYGRRIVEFLGERPRCPIVLHFGERDAAIPMSDVEKIKAAHPEVPVHIYPAGHGFNSDRRQDYDAGCARLARERTLALFRANGAR
ncbi:MAG: dienelactone hydrolase family protein [Alphaproteobacteria bacterium]|nr:dienelactone hydrolase family protein [Alphaproteobacteria bacterium]